MPFKDVTLEELKKIFHDNRLDYFIKKEKGNLVKVHFIIKDEQ